MSRELTVQLIEKRRGIHQDLHEVESEYAQLQQSHSWLTNEDTEEDFPELDEKELEIQAKLLNLQHSLLKIRRRLHRANFFGLRYTHGLIPTLCIACFVDHHKESFMVRMPVGNDCWDGLLQFECPACNHVLRVNPD